MLKNFRDALLERIERDGTSLKKVADGAGVSYEQLKKLKQNKSKSTNVDDAMKIASYFGVSLDDFLSVEGTQARAEIVDLYNRLSEPERQFLLKSLKGLSAADLPAPE